MNQEKNILLAIDPGDVESAFVFIDIDTYKPLYFAKEKNEIMIDNIFDYALLVCCGPHDESLIYNVAIEMVASYGMAVGKSVFNTCVEIGRLTELFELSGCDVDYIYRKDEKMCICGQMKAKDSNIRQALIDRFAKLDFNNGKGTKKNPDWFYGFSKDVWQAYSVGVTWIDAHKGLYQLKGY